MLNFIPKMILNWKQVIDAKNEADTTIYSILWAAAACNILFKLKKHYWVSLQNEKNAPWFYAEPCRAEKHVQEYKKNRSRTELNGFRVYRVTLKTLNPKPWGGGRV